MDVCIRFILFNVSISLWVCMTCRVAHLRVHVNAHAHKHTRMTYTCTWTYSYTREALRAATCARCIYTQTYLQMHFWGFFPWVTRTPEDTSPGSFSLSLEWLSRCDINVQLLKLFLRSNHIRLCEQKICASEGLVFSGCYVRATLSYSWLPRLEWRVWIVYKNRLFDTWTSTDWGFSGEVLNLCFQTKQSKYTTRFDSRWRSVPCHTCVDWLMHL